jgi:hypothetical protein
MESLSFPGGKHVGIAPSSRPSRAVEQAINLGMLFNAAAFMRASHQTCRVHDEYRKMVKRDRSRRDRQAYLNKCYPRFFVMRQYGQTLSVERRPDGIYLAPRKVSP